jgi:hypothetical protein
MSLLFLVPILAGCAADSGSRSGGPAAQRSDRKSIPRSKKQHVAEIRVSSKAPEIIPNQTVTGRLGKGSTLLPGEESPYDVWSFRGKQGELARCRMESAELDAYLILARREQDRLIPLAEDDDSGGGRQASIVRELPDDGEYCLMANSAAPKEGGIYSLNLTLIPPPSYPTGGDLQSAYALLVGIGDYPGRETDLPGAQTDLGLLEELLQSRFGFKRENILKIADAEATRLRVMNAFMRHLGQAGAGGVALFYYTGHGVQLQGNYGLAEPMDPEEDGRDEALYLGDGGIILDEEIGAMADRLSTDRILIILDSCFSGTGTRGKGWRKAVTVKKIEPYLTIPEHFLERASDSGHGPGALVDILRDPGRHVLLAASKENEEARAVSGLPGLSPPDSAAGVFTYHLARIIESHGGDLTFEETIRRVDEAIRGRAEAEGFGVQTPVALGGAKGKKIGLFLAARKAE